MAAAVTDQTFATARASSDVPVVLEFVAAWCGNCRRIAPALEALAAEYAGRVRLLIVDVEESAELVRRYEVSSTPTLIALAGEDPIVTVVGSQSVAGLRTVFDTAVLGASPASADWAPGEACTLPTADRPLRLGEFETLFADALRSSERLEPTLLRLELAGGPELESRVRDLTAREVDCCDFFAFDIHGAEGALTLDVRVPPSHAEVLTGMEHQAVSAMAGGPDH